MNTDTMIMEANTRIAQMEQAVRSLPRPDGLPRGMYLDGGAFDGVLVPSGDDPEESEFMEALAMEESAQREWSEGRGESTGYKGGA